MAVDALAHMLSQGLCPSPPAFRAVLDVHLGRGTWEEVAALLSSMAQHGSGALDVQLLNGIIERCGAAGSPGAAQAAYECLCKAGLAPSPATMAALLGPLRSQRPAAEVAEAALQLAEQAEQTPGGSAAALRAVLDACAARRWTDVAVLLLGAIEAAGGAPTVEQIDGALAACAASGDLGEVGAAVLLQCRNWGAHGSRACPALSGLLPEHHAKLLFLLLSLQAHATFCKVEQRGLPPSPDSHLHMARALCGAGQWGEAARAYDALVAAG